MRTTHSVGTVLGVGAWLVLSAAVAFANPAANEVLLIAITMEDEAKIRVALRAGARINGKTRDGKMALHWASRESSPKTVNFLLALGARVDAKDGRGDTPLHVSVHHERKDLVALFLARGADVHATDAKKRTPLHVAAGKAVGDLYRNLNMPRKPVDAALATLLLAEGARVGLRDAAGRTPMLVAAANGNVEVATLLLASKADLKAVDEAGAGVALLALVEAKGKGLEFFLDRGADANAKTKAGFDLLNVAAEVADPNVIRLLLARGASVDAAGADGHPPIHRAIHHGKIFNLIALIDGGADVTRVADAFRAKLVAWRGGDGRSFVHEATSMGSVKSLEFALALGQGVDAAEKRGWTPLHFAVVAGRADMARRLIEAGAPLDARIDGHHAPLGLAAVHAQEDMVTLLLERGADANVRGPEQRTPLHFAAEGHSFGMLLLGADEEDMKKDRVARAAVIRVLLEAGADRTRKDEAGKTPQDVATENKETELAKLLAP